MAQSRNISLERLKEIVEQYFRPPFLPDGVVEARFVSHVEGEPRILALRIGPRDVWIESNGHVSGCGTDLTCELILKGRKQA
jgi:hypothetical protein